MMEKNINNELHTLISKAETTPQRVGVCICAYEAVEKSESPSKLLAWFAVETEELWFKEEQKRAQGSSRLSDIISMLENHGAEYEKEGSVTEGVSVASEDVKLYLSKYKGFTKGVIDFLSNNGYSEDEYYSSLWSTLSSLLTEKTDLEKGVCLYAVLLDKRTPYYAVKPGLRMSNAQYQKVTEKIAPQLDKMRFILHLANNQRTETASQILDVMDELKTKEDKAVFISKVLRIDAPKNVKTIEISSSVE